MEDEIKYESVTQDVSNPNVTDAVHAIALGNEKDYKAMAKVKALVDHAFNEVSLGKVEPRVALRVLRDDLKIIFVKY